MPSSAESNQTPVRETPLIHFSQLIGKLVPDAITAFFGTGLDVFIGEALVAMIGLFILWRRWRGLGVCR